MAAAVNPAVPAAIPTQTNKQTPPARVAVVASGGVESRVRESDGGDRIDREMGRIFGVGRKSSPENFSGGCGGGRRLPDIWEGEERVMRECVIMNSTKEQQKELDDALVAPEHRLKIGKSNLRLSSNLKSKEPTLQVVLDDLKFTPFYNAFEIFADVPEIYMQEF
ncbi:hypothetical protein Tco_0874715 [Tanacetum coccineum]|uniref:Uncharacterized protein n=1 Tax=Tanacetum coccineum TaxID=301880 RepID=A0ABQ5BP43_9ASTR